MPEPPGTAGSVASGAAHDTPADPPARQGIVPALWAAAWRYRTRTLAAVLLLVLAKIASVCVPLVFKEVIDRFTLPDGLTTTMAPGTSQILPAGGQVIVLPVLLLAGYAALRFSSSLFTELRDLCFARVTLVTVADFARSALAHLHRMGPSFPTQRPIGALIRDVDRGTAGIGFLLGALLFTLLPTLVEIVAVVVIMAAGYSLWFTAVIALTFVAYATHTAVMTRRRVAFQRRVNEMDSRASGLLMDSLVNQEAVRNNARESQEVARYQAARGEWIEHSVDNQKALSTLHVGQAAIIAFGVGAIMLLAGREVVHGRMTVGDLVLVNAYVLQICLPLNALGFLFREARDALTNAEKLRQMLAMVPEVADSPRAVALAITRGEVAFEHVDFSYEPGRQVLWDVSFRIEPGQTVAVVGGSGSGKSTLARLLLRVHDPQRGRVLIDGADVGGVTLASLRSAVGVVPQDSTLFNESIAYNIAYGRPGASIAEIVEAARAAQVDEFIASLPQQFDTLVGERGLKLSGGEKQRIAIARAFLKNAPIMILDEATSALDTRSERAIQGQLDRIASGRTTLVIAHRLSTIVDADRILVLDRGRIVEQGRHDELIAHGGLYAQLWDLQRQKQEFDRLERRLVRQPLNLAVLLADAIDNLRPLLQARSVQLYTYVDLEQARVSADPAVLSQAIWDLCSHAVGATAPGGRLELRLDRHEGRARLTVSDGRHARQTPSPVDTHQPAMDPMTLRSAIERQGGQLTIVPPTSVQGMRFIVELPLQAVSVVPPEVPAGTPEVLPPPGLREVGVMVIDDNAPTREALAGVLEAEGARTLAFGSGAQAFHWLESHPVWQWPVVLICDLSLGEEDGRQVMVRIRELENRRGVALDQRLSAIALTGSAQAAERIMALMSGFQSHLAKPVQPQALVAAIVGLTGRHAACPEQGAAQGGVS